MATAPDVGEGVDGVGRRDRGLDLRRRVRGSDGGAVLADLRLPWRPNRAGVVVGVVVVVLPGGPDPPVCADAGTAIATTNRVVIPATARRRLQLSVLRIQQFSFVGLRG
jgi:hypothetical protein